MMLLAVISKSSWTQFIPDSARLKVGGGTGENSSRNRLARLASIHDTLGYRGEFASNVSVKIHVEYRGLRTRCRGRPSRHNQADDESLPLQESPSGSVYSRKEEWSERQQRCCWA